MQKRRRRKPPAPIIGDGIVGVPLTMGMVAWVDEADYPIVAPYIWTTYRRKYTCYAITKINGHTKTMQNVIMNPASGLEVDHWQVPNGLWNFRWNLRSVSHSENMRNSRRCVGSNCPIKLMPREYLTYEEKLSEALSLAA